MFVIEQNRKDDCKMATIFFFAVKYFLAGFLFLRLLAYFDHRRFRLTASKALTAVVLSVGISSISELGKDWMMLGEHLFLSAVMTLCLSALLAAAVGLAQELFQSNRKQAERQIHKNPHRITMSGRSHLERAS